jgi:putative hemolysin
VDTQLTLSSVLTAPALSVHDGASDHVTRPDTVAAALLRWSLERLLALPTLRQLHGRARQRPETHFSDRALAVLDVPYIVDGDLSTIPATGPLIVIANHPLGALDGLVLSSLLSRRRPDVRLLANHWLGIVPELREQLFLVNPFGGRRAADENVAPTRAAVRWVREGGCLCVFPAGTVSHFQWRTRRVADPAWSASLGRLLRLTRAAVVPCFIDGGNSWLFHGAGLVHPALRTALLPRELLRHRGRGVTVHVGARVRPADLTGGGVGREVGVTNALRARTDALARRRPMDERTRVRREVSDVMTTQRLTPTGADGLSVFWTTATQAPRLLQEIGRERERTFRAIGEGTGRAIDLDAFDRHYLHLCAWDEQRGELVGAYRLRVVGDEASGANASGSTMARPDHGLYTQTLFRFDERLIGRLAPAIELGRAFVRTPYQKDYGPLMLLWRGIGQIVAQHPGVRHLFGAASIGATYGEAARALMLAYLRRHAFDSQLAPLVSACHPPRERRDARVDAARLLPDEPDLHALNAGVMTLDPARRPIPVLLRQYLKLDARVLGFNVDPLFSDAIDALVVVDLLRVPEAVLRRYMGADLARGYVARHQPRRRSA